MNNFLQKILAVELDKSISHYFHNNWNNIRLFLLLFLVNVFIYGQHLFFHSLATDDYARFLQKSGFHQISWNGRWGADLFNSILSGPLHTLPYFNILLGIFFVTLAGFLTSFLWKQKQKFTIIMVTLLCSVNIYFAKNFFFITNISTWFTTFLGVYALHLFYSRSTWKKTLSLFMLIFSIGAYQTIVQVCLMIIIVRVTLDLWQIKNRKEIYTIFKENFFAILFVGLSAIFSFFITETLIKIYNFTKGGRLAVSSFYPEEIIKVLVTIPLYFFLIILLAFYHKPDKRVIFWRCFYLFIFFLAAHIIIDFSSFFTGYSADVRARYPEAWLLSAFFIFSFYSYKFLKNLSILFVSLLLVIQILFINVYFYHSNRQTEMDILRVNQIVTQIRSNFNYNKEPISFYIQGEKQFSNKNLLLQSQPKKLISQQQLKDKIFQTVLNFLAQVFIIGTDQQVLATGWSKYNVFRHFTDFNFKKMKENSYKKIEEELIEKGKIIYPYPAKNSIFVEDNKVILFLDTTSINEKINSKK